MSVVVPTLGRPSLAALLRALTRAMPAPFPLELLLVDDRVTGRVSARPGPAGEPPALPVPPRLAGEVRVLTGRAAGPAAARNAGWRAARYEWVAFLDDDVLPDPDWLGWLAADLAVGPEVGGVQGRVRVPLPEDRAPTDWERSTAGLATAAWITADMAYRRAALVAAGGFDERFPRAYREDAELAYRVAAGGWQLRVGRRQVAHPVRPPGRWASLRAQRGNADDALLRRLYGRHWRQRLAIPPGRRPWHVTTVLAGAAAVILTVLAAGTGGRTRVVTATAAGAAGAGWLAATGQFAASRLRETARDPGALVGMVASSVAIPPLATGHWLRGWWRHRGAEPVRFASSAIGNPFSRAHRVV